jgi:hypothetical protein
MKRVVSSVMDTGEVMEGAVLGMFFPNGKMDSEGWIAMAQDALMAVAKMDLGDEARVCCLRSWPSWIMKTYILLNQAEIGADIGMQRANVSRALAKLEAEGCC